MPLPLIPIIITAIILVGGTIVYNIGKAKVKSANYKDKANVSILFIV